MGRGGRGKVGRRRELKHPYPAVFFSHLQPRPLKPGNVDKMHHISNSHTHNHAQRERERERGRVRVRERERERERERDRQTDRQTDRKKQTERDR